MRDNLPADDPAVFAATTAYGDMWIELRRYREAEAAFSAAEKMALAAGRDDGALMAGMKRAWVMAALGQGAKARSMLDMLEARPAAKEAGFKSALRVMRLRLAARDADEAEVSRLVAQIGEGQASPVLVYAPGYDDDAITSANKASRAFDQANAGDAGGADIMGIRWADVGFTIGADGRTADIEVLRGVHAKAWLAPALRQIAGRRYSTAGKSDGASREAVYRIERFTLRTDYIKATKSLIARRVPTGGYDVLDLTQAPAAPPTD